MQKFLINNITITSLTINELKNIFIKILSTQTNGVLLTTFNLDFLRIANKDDNFRYICQKSYLNLPDGYGIISLIKKKYNTKINRITGNDIFPILLKLAKINNYRLAIIGGRYEVASNIKSKLIKEYKFASNNILILSPPYKFEDNNIQNKKVIKRTIEFRPDIVLVALGCPRQEKWLYKNMDSFGSKINVGIGATLDFYSGYKKRAPLLFQKFGIEWLWRLLNEPKRLFKRYIILDLPFFFRMIIKIRK